MGKIKLVGIFESGQVVKTGTAWFTRTCDVAVQALDWANVRHPPSPLYHHHPASLAVPCGGESVPSAELAHSPPPCEQFY